MARERAAPLLPPSRASRRFRPALARGLGAGWLGLTFALSTALAQPLPLQSPEWSELSRQQQSILAPLAADWPRIDADRRSKWLDIASRFPAMPPLEQQRVQARMATWSKMSPDERARARLTYQEAKALTPFERGAFWEAYQQLPDETKRQWAEKGRSAASGNTAPRPVAPTLVQPGPGAATTTLMNRRPAAQAAPQAATMPRPDEIDRTTRLPKAPQAPQAPQPPAR